MRRWLIQFARLATSWELVILAAIAPALLFPSAGTSWVLLVLPILWLGAWLGRARSVPRTALDLPILGLLAMVGVSAIVTPDIRNSLPKITGTLLAMCAYYGVVRRARTIWEQQWAVLLFVFSGVGLAIIGLLGSGATDKLSLWVKSTARLPAIIRGLPGAPDEFPSNEVAGTLVLYIPLQFSLLAASLGGREPFRWLRHPAANLGLQIALIFVTCGALLLTESRGAWLGVIIALLGLLAWQCPPARRWLLFIGAGVAVLFFIPGLRASLAQPLQPISAGLARDLAQRRDVWLRAIYGIQDFPMTGMGMNMFRRLMPIVYPTPLLDPGFDVAHAHNQFLQVALDLGLPGLTAYVALWICAVVVLIQGAARGNSAAFSPAVAQGLLAGLAAFSLFGLTDAIALGAKTGLVFWLALALAVVSSAGPQPEATVLSAPAESLTSSEPRAG
jgi:putative inorganic carbon (HCO3(-)) transporter